jgi:hypothetical protein
MKARNHTITCRDMDHLLRLEADYTWLGEEFEVNREALTITLLARPKDSKRARKRAERIAARQDPALEEYANRYN